MTERIVVVGGAGYIGSRFVLRLHQEILTRQFSRRPEARTKIVIVDPCILGDEVNTDPIPGMSIERTTWGEFEYLPTDTVVWLASVHKPATDGKKWDDLLDELCADGPDFVADEVARFVYVSSMQVITGSDDVYSENKRCGEWMLTRKEKRDWRIVRPGTVWGGLGRPGPKRLHTVPNAWLACKKPPPDDYATYTAYIWPVVNTLVDATLHDKKARSITNVADFESPTTAEQVRTFEWEELDDFVAEEPGRHPMELYAEYYNIS